MTSFLDPDEERKRQAILKHLDMFGVVDKDRASFSPKKKKRRSPKKILQETTHRIDLHGLTEDQARSVLVNTILRCKEAGVEKVYIVHGKGRHSGTNGPVLQKMVRQVLRSELRDYIADFGAAPPAAGGDGVTIAWVGAALE